MGFPWVSHGFPMGVLSIFHTLGSSPGSSKSIPRSNALLLPVHEQDRTVDWEPSRDKPANECKSENLLDNFMEDRKNVERYIYIYIYVLCYIILYHIILCIYVYIICIYYHIIICIYSIYIYTYHLYISYYNKYIYIERER